MDTDQDPRIERSRRVILEAVLDELGAVGYGALTIEAVAARAGVGKSTIYRHWPGKLALVEDAFRTLKAQALIPESGTDPRADHQRSSSRSPSSSRSRRTRRACPRSSTPPSATRRSARSTATSAPNDAPSSSTCSASAVSHGELPADTNAELLADALVGPIVMRRLMFYEPFDPKQVPALVDQVLPS